jgi:hypothetical protein
MGSMVFGVMIASGIVPTFLDGHFPWVEMEFTNKMLVVLFDPGGFPLRTLGHVGWTSCTTRRLAWSSTRFAALGVRQDLQHWKFAEYPERWVER